MTAGTGHLEVLRPGPFATVQDLGRPGFSRLGVGASGAADPDSLRLANRLAGNHDRAAAVEATMGGLALRFARSARVGLSGAPCPVSVDGRPGDTGVPLSVLAGEVLELGTPPRGLRTYVAVSGGIDVPPVLGSRSTDTLARLGPEPLRAGTRLPLGRAPGAPDALAAPDPPGPFGEVLDVAPQRARGTGALLRAIPGPRDDWFTAEALDTLFSRPFTVSQACDRVGMRLDGPALARTVDRQLPSEGTVVGALQVSPGGRPILFLADHPVTGGYPVIAVVVEADVGIAAQLRPGETVRFRRPPFAP